MPMATTNTQQQYEGAILNQRIKNTERLAEEPIQCHHVSTLKDFDFQPCQQTALSIEELQSFMKYLKFYLGKIYCVLLWTWFE